MTKDEALRISLEALESNRRKHHYCEDTWYSCPKHEDGCANDSEGDECNCGTDKANAGIDQAIAAIKAALEAKDGCQCPACKVAPHASDCAVHNEPAYPARQCNCGASGEPAAWMYPDDLKRFETSEAYAEAYSIAMVSPTQGETVPLYRAPQKQPPVIDKSVARRIATQLGWEPPRKPLTDEDIERLWPMRPTDDVINFARAIEAAHGIKGEA